MKGGRNLALLACWRRGAPAHGAAEPAPDEELRALKQELVALNRDLFLLEEELLFPASTQVAVYLSMDVGKYFALDAVELSINGQRVAKYLYTEREVDALHRGGVHRLYLGNLKTGQHELVAVLTGPWAAGPRVPPGHQPGPSRRAWPAATRTGAARQRGAAAAGVPGPGLGVADGA
jgi:hypothetical protein